TIRISAGDSLEACAVPACGIKQTACSCDGSDMLLCSLLTCTPVKCLASFGSATSIMQRGFERVLYVLLWMVVRACEGAGLEKPRAATPSRGFKSPTIRVLLGIGTISNPEFFFFTGIAKANRKRIIPYDQSL